MVFKSKKELDFYLKKLIPIGSGSIGECFYRQKEKDVLKIFYDIEEDEEYNITITKEEILRFSKVNNKTFIWPTEVIYINDKIVGYISPYIKANNLYKINPLLINLNNFESSIMLAYNDIKIISNNGIKLFDTYYNTLYNKKFYVIDQDEYSFTNIESSKLEQINIHTFNYELFHFLVDNLFEQIVSDNKELKELYKDKEELLLFMKLFRKRLSELNEKEIIKLKDATKYRTQYDEENSKYKRFLTKTI